MNARKTPPLKSSQPTLGNETFRFIEDDEDSTVNTASLAHWRMDLITEGYHQAANLIAEGALQSKSSLDSLVYPIAFNFRHAFELQLKRALEYLKILNPGLPSVELVHTLLPLWNSLKPHVEIRFPNPNRPIDLPTIESVLSDFDAIDRWSFAFRYENDRKGNLNLTDVTHVNIPNLRDRSNKLYSQLNYIAGTFEGDVDGIS